MTNNELKPCPFCGGEAQFIRTENGIVRISCSICGAATLFTSDASFAIQKWNKRKRKSKFIRGAHFAAKKQKYMRLMIELLQFNARIATIARTITGQSKRL